MDDRRDGSIGSMVSGSEDTEEIYLVRPSFFECGCVLSQDRVISLSMSARVSVS